MKIKTKLRCEVVIYALRDSHGNTWCQAVEDSSHIVNVYGITNADRGHLFYDGQGGYLQEWADKNHLEFHQEHRTLHINFPK